MASRTRRVRCGALVAIGVVGGGLLVGTEVATFAVGIGVDVAAPRNIIDAAALDERRAGEPDLWLIVGNDARSTTPGDDVPPHTGDRADTLLLCALTDWGVRVVALPRDLHVESALYGGQRLAGLLDYSRIALVAGVRELTGLPVHHYVEVRMDAVVAAVDELGGVSVSVSVPSRDRVTGLALAAGEQLVGGEEALAYVRSRQLEQEHAGAWTPEGGDDAARVDRQLRFLRSVVTATATDRAGWQIPGVVAAALPHVSIDQTTGARDVAALVGALHRGWTTSAIPTERVRSYEDLLSPFPPAHLGGGAHRVLSQPAAALMLDEVLGAQP